MGRTLVMMMMMMMMREDNIRMDLREVGCDPGEWIDLAEDRDQWRAYVRAVMNLRVPKNQLVISHMYYN